MRIKIKNQSDVVNDQIRFLVMTVFGISMLLFALIVDTPREIMAGLLRIIYSPDILITDYIEVGGMGAAFVNSGLLTLIFTLLIKRFNVKFNGITFAALFLTAGFAFFGKNLLNVWFIITGVFLYTWVQKENFSNYIYVAIFGTAMSPLVSEIIFGSINLSEPMKMGLGILLGIGMGFVLPPLATHLLKIHQGYNLYNIGFAAGMLGTIIVSILKSFGYFPAPILIWSTGNNVILGGYLYTLSIVFIITGYILNKKTFKGYTKILKYSGRLVTDFTALVGYGLSLVNVGICGIIATTAIILIGGDLNGPTIAGIFTIMGFSAFGKHPKNIIPIMLGVYIASVLKLWGINDPGMQLALLFSTGLAPIAGEYGSLVGIITGFLHSSVVINVGALHGGLNLYNNGFAAGIIAAIVIPILNAFRKDDN